MSGPVRKTKNAPRSPATVLFYTGTSPSNKDPSPGQIVSQSVQKSTRKSKSQRSSSRHTTHSRPLPRDSVGTLVDIHETIISNLTSSPEEVELLSKRKLSGTFPDTREEHLKPRTSSPTISPVLDSSSSEHPAPKPILKMSSGARPKTLR